MIDAMNPAQGATSQSMPCSKQRRHNAVVPRDLQQDTGGLPKMRGRFGAMLLAFSLALCGWQASAGETSGRALSVEQKPLADIAVPSSHLTVDTWLNRADGTYGVGESLELALRLNQDAYVTVFDVDATGRMTKVFPNALSPDGWLEGNKVHRLPGIDDTYRLRVTRPLGVSLIKVIATTADAPIVDGFRATRSGPFDTYEEPARRIAERLAVVINEGTDAQWAVDRQIYEVVEDAPRPATPVELVIPLGTEAAGNPPTLRPNDFDFAFKLHMAFDEDFNRGIHRVRAGDDLSVHVVVERDCELALINVDAAGVSTVVYPNRLESVFLRRGLTVLPRAGSPVRLRPSGAGHQTLIGLCTEEPGLFEEIFAYGRDGRSLLPTVTGGTTIADILENALRDRGRTTAIARADYEIVAR